MYYEQSGVNVNLADKLVNHISSYSQHIGKFAAVTKLPHHDLPKLVMSCDGVGTKILLAQLAKQLYNRPLNSIGQDCVAMVVNDMICENATPLFFMDYYATGKLQKDEYLEILSGIKEACDTINVQLVGGETAELPGMLSPNVVDVCGFGLGVQDAEWKKPSVGDIVLGLYSSGLHSNGFSLVRSLIEGGEFYNETIIKDLLVPTPLYVSKIHDLKQKGFNIKAIAHITGGGFDNIDRVLPEDLRVHYFHDKPYYNHQHIYSWILSTGTISSSDLKKVFNCGIGMVVIIDHTQDLVVPFDDYEVLGTLV